MKEVKYECKGRPNEGLRARAVSEMPFSRRARAESFLKHMVRSVAPVFVVVVVGFFSLDNF